LEFSASVGFIYKESVTMHGHTVRKFIYRMLKDKLRNCSRNQFE
jgi:hypothetical protein